MQINPTCRDIRGIYFSRGRRVGFSERSGLGLGQNVCFFFLFEYYRVLNFGLRRIVQLDRHEWDLRRERGDDRIDHQVDRDGELGPVVAMVAIADAERPAMADLAHHLHEALGVERLGLARIGTAHAATRRAVSRISAIMLGMPWVRLELSWFLRSSSRKTERMRTSGKGS